MTAEPSGGASGTGPAGQEPGGTPRSGHVAAGRPGNVSVDAIRSAVQVDARSQWRLDTGADLSVRVETVTWGDGSLGCPTPGVMYLQALVPGWRLVVIDGKRELVYHASRRGAWVQCPADRARAPLPGSSAR